MRERKEEKGKAGLQQAGKGMNERTDRKGEVGKVETSFMLGMLCVAIFSTPNFKHNSSNIVTSYFLFKCNEIIARC
jgi:hypothetical protein